MLGAATVLFAGCQSTRLPALDGPASHPAHTEAAQSPVLHASDIYATDLGEFASTVLPASGMNHTEMADDHAHHMPMNKPVMDLAVHGHAEKGHADADQPETDQPETADFPDRVIELLNDLDRALDDIHQQLKEEKPARISRNARVIIDVLDTVTQTEVPADPHVWHKTMKEFKTVRDLALKLESSDSHVERTSLHEALEVELNAFLKAIGFNKLAEEQPAHNHGGAH